MIITIPIIALMTVLLPFSAVSSFPAAVIYQKPPIIKNSTATPKAMPKSQSMTIAISPLTFVVEQFNPEEGLQLKPVLSWADAIIGAVIIVIIEAIVSHLRSLEKSILLIICFKLFTPSHNPSPPPQLFSFLLTIIRRAWKRVG
jgi:hypothetical protein